MFCDALLRSDSHELVTVGALTYPSSLSEHEDGIPQSRCNAVGLISDTWNNLKDTKTPCRMTTTLNPYWLDEDDWLVTICPLPKDEDDPEVNLETLNWIGRLFGFATATNTRVLALVGVPNCLHTRSCFRSIVRRVTRSFFA